MPTYGYRCPKCGNAFEVFRKITDAGGADCPECGASAKRVFHPVGIIFKGSGFYSTDNARKRPAPVSENPDTKKETKKPAKKDEATPKVSAKE